MLVAPAGVKQASKQASDDALEEQGYRQGRITLEAAVCAVLSSHASGARLCFRPSPWSLFRSQFVHVVLDRSSMCGLERTCTALKDKAIAARGYSGHQCFPKVSNGGALVQQMLLSYK